MGLSHSLLDMLPSMASFHTLGYVSIPYCTIVAYERLQRVVYVGLCVLLAIVLYCTLLRVSVCSAPGPAARALVPSYGPGSHSPHGYDLLGYPKGLDRPPAGNDAGVPLFFFDMPGGYPTQGGTTINNINRCPLTLISQTKNI